MVEIIIFVIKVILGSISVLGVLYAIPFILGKKISDSIITYWAKYFFDKKLEDYKSQELKRQKAVLISNLFAEWLKHEREPDKLNQLAFEAYLWLPKHIALKLTQRLTNQNEAPDMKEIISDTRVWILGSEDERLTIDEIVHFPQLSDWERAMRQH